MDLKNNGVEAHVADTISGLITVIVAENELLDVVSGADVRQMLQLESSKESAGCGDAAACIADVAGALGAQYVVSGSVGALGTLLNINLTIFDANKAKSVGRVALDARSLEELPAKLRPGIAELLAHALGRTKAEASPAPTPPPPPSSGPSLLPTLISVSGAVVAVLGGILLAVGVVPVIKINTAEDSFKKEGDVAFRDAAKDIQEKAFDNGIAPFEQVAGVVVVVVGAALVTGGIFMGLSSGSAE